MASRSQLSLLLAALVLVPAAAVAQDDVAPRVDGDVAGDPVAPGSDDADDDTADGAPDETSDATGEVTEDTDADAVEAATDEPPVSPAPTHVLDDPTSEEEEEVASVTSPEDDQGQVDDEEDHDPEPATPAGDAASVYDRVLAVAATGGLDTPFGVVGAAIEFSPIRYVVIYAGGGVSRSGGRFTGGVRLQYPVGGGALGLFGGLAGGPLDWDSKGSANSRIHRWWSLALFLHAGVSFEYRWDIGLYGRLAVGIEALVTPSAPDVCTFGDGSPCDTYDPEMPALGGDIVSDGLALPIRPWLGLSVGYAFDL